MTRASSSTPNPLAMPDRSRVRGTSLRARRPTSSICSVFGGSNDARPSRRCNARQIGSRAPPPNPQARTRSPTPMSKAPPDARPISSAVERTWLSSRGIATHTPTGAAFSRLRSELRFPRRHLPVDFVDRCLQRVCQHFLVQVSGDAKKIADQREPMVGPVQDATAGDPGRG